MAIWFITASLMFVILRALGYLFGLTDQQKGWKITDTNALAFALLAIAAAILESFPKGL